MNKQKINYFLVGMLFFIVTSCNKNDLKITGSVKNAKDSVMYFENMALDGIHTIDSVKLAEDGKFSFETNAPNSPEFYRLRIGRQTINVTADTIKTLVINADMNNFSTEYNVENSEDNAKIKELAVLQINLQAAISNVVASNKTPQEKQEAIDYLINTYKDNVTRNYIYAKPMSAYAYFALFQNVVIANTPISIFNPSNNSNDIKAFGAVATSWDALYPTSLRAQNLHNIAIQDIQNDRIIKNKQRTAVLDMSGVEEASLIDLSLTSNTGKIKKLTDLKGKVVLLDFHSFSMKDSAKRIMMLRDLYNTYKDKGFEIYQVSVGDSQHLWKTQTEALPWISVIDDNSSTQAYLATAPGIPCSYIIGRDNSIIKGANQITNLYSDIKAAL